MIQTSVLLVVAAQALQWSEAPPLPRPSTNNAVAAATTATGPAVFSFLGLDSTTRWDGVVNWAFRWDVGTEAWREVTPVPGPGRLAGTAQSVGGRIYLFGGYTVAADGSERSLPNVDIYQPDTDRWSRGADMPDPVDDAVSGVWRDSLIFLVSGWHDRDNVTLVQTYDPARDAWQEATPIPGPPVFGHAGALTGNTLVYFDGVRVDRNPRRFVPEHSSWRGDIDPTDPTRIVWRRIADHPGPPLYRAAAGAVARRMDPSAPATGWVVVAGGTDNPYNYTGIGYNDVPAEPRAAVFAYDVVRDRWIELGRLPFAVMDLRGLAIAGNRVVLAGGMRAARDVSHKVVVTQLRDFAREVQR